MSNENDKISLSFIFLALLFVSTYHVFSLRYSNTFNVMAVLIILVSLYIAYDFVTEKRNKKMEECRRGESTNEILETIDEENLNETEESLDDILKELQLAGGNQNKNFTREVDYELATDGQQNNFNPYGLGPRNFSGVLPGQMGEYVRDGFTDESPAKQKYNFEQVPDYIKMGASETNNGKPLYNNLEDLTHLNYYNGQGLNCAYDLQFARDYSNIKDLYHLMGCNGDTKLANRMKYASLKNKFAEDTRARYDRTSSQRYFTDELAIEEKRIWWENPDVYDSVM